MSLDITKYLVVGRENTCGRPVRQIVKMAVQAGFTCVQIRSKTAGAKEIIQDCKECAQVINELNKSNQVTLLVDDRLDIVLACREMGIKVDGIHVGQSDIPVCVCRKYLGKDAIIGLSAPTHNLIKYIEETDVSEIDYFGAGPFHPTNTKPDCGMDETGRVTTRTVTELKELAQKSPVPVVVGGGVKLNDINALKQTGVAGFFVVSAVAGAEEPYEEAKKLVEEWDS